MTLPNCKGALEGPSQHVLQVTAAADDHVEAVMEQSTDVQVHQGLPSSPTTKAQRRQLTLAVSVSHLGLIVGA